MTGPCKEGCSVSFPTEIMGLILSVSNKVVLPNMIGPNQYIRAWNIYDNTSVCGHSFHVNDLIFSVCLKIFQAFYHEKVHCYFALKESLKN